jgi:threonine synthase
MHVSGFRCLRCTAVQEAGFDGFACPACGGNLDVTYDYAAASRHFAAAFDGGGGGIFRFAPLLPISGRHTPFPLRVGSTPLYKASRLGECAGLLNLYLKDDTGNPSASFKDRASAVALCRAVDTGADIVSAASTGNAGSSLACVAAALGAETVVFVPENAPPAKLAQLLSYGAQVLAVRGSYDDAYDLCLEASRAFGWFNRSTGFNPFTREGKKTWAFETWEDLNRQVPDRVVVPTGDGNIISGTWKGWQDLRAVGLIDRVPKIDCAQSTSSDAICRTIDRLRDGDQFNGDWSTVSVDEVHASTLADSISVNQPRDGLAAVRAVIESGGLAVTVPDEDILSAVTEMARHTGIFPEPAAATPWAALKKLARDKLIDRSERVVCIVTGNGLKDTAGAKKAVGTPLTIDPSLEAVTNALQI